MKNEMAKNICFYEKDHTFTIAKGDVGTYSCDDVSGCQILYEDNKYKGKTPMFSHLVWIGGLQPIWHTSDIWTGICFTMKDGKKVYGYISNEATQLNTLQFHKDTKEAEEIYKSVLRIITKDKN